MPSLQIRELPDNIYRLLQKKAQAEHRSLAQEAIIVMSKGLDTSASNKTRRAKLLQAIADNQDDIESFAELDPVELIREDRQR